MPVTIRYQSSGTVPGNAGPVRMQGGSLTLGRGPSNDVVLPDPDRLLSKNHCVIEDHNGNVVIVDLSTNGTFLNYSKIPLGKTPTPLNNGDVLALGSYELVVEIGSDLPELDDRIAPPMAQDPLSHGNADKAPDPLDLLNDPEPGGDFLDDLLGAEAGPTGPSQLNPVDPIDDLLPPLGEDEDPFFHKPSDGREGEGASQPMHSPSAQDSFRPQDSSGVPLIPDDWDDDFLSPEPPAPARQPDPPEAEPAPPAKAEEPAPMAVSQPVAARPDMDTGSDGGAGPPESQGDAARAFLAAVGADEVAIADADLPVTMARMGRVMKTLVTGLREILMTRTSIKSEFRIEQTMISAGGNNPLKFSISPEQAIEAMVKPGARGYLSAESAAEQALSDIKAHEVAMVTGMEAALKGVLSRLDPKVLASQIETSGGIGGLLKGKKARYWEVYEKLYSDISDQAENDFHDLFSREFARAYKQQLDKLKDGSD
ncbi:type VI secretion system-associated FHA domain protein TagH [Sedimentitalea sp. JM2-8]|uniref:Type VI secretion system-associated FHA domain protein TagH n=1 Tax=Sedimentitalea xiamensis TaxID=3050037 RepID=A0ABT7FI48_9RHOB|nr:type VI secretion system-associated FHA domain protein TagH [Sedimentitalea xiamensis]MDK3074806.1 type VI secretion system-associated FHA domain protein TagH [Sedimentitalea xiamensis]